MITERARVLRVEDNVAWVQCESQSGCARCEAGEGCGAGLFSRLLRRRLQELPLALPGNLENLAAGDHVLLGLSVTAVQNAALLAYGLPLAGVLLGAFGGNLFPGGDPGALLGAVSGLAAGAWLARHSSKRLAGDPALQPVLLHQLGEHEPCPPPQKA